MHSACLSLHEPRFNPNVIAVRSCSCIYLLMPVLTDRLWRNVSTFALPSFIFEDDVLSLSFAALSVYVLMCELACRKGSNCILTLSQRRACEKTGYGSASVERAFRELRDLQFIRAAHSREKNAAGRFGENVYELMWPGAKLGLSEYGNGKKPNLRTRLYASDVMYFVAPCALVDVLNVVDGKLLALILSCLRSASLRGQRHFEMPSPQLRQMSGLSVKSYAAAADRLTHSEENPLDYRFIDLTISGHNVVVDLLNPYTQVPLMYEEEKEAEHSATRSVRFPVAPPEYFVGWLRPYISGELRIATGTNLKANCPNANCPSRTGRRRGQTLCIDPYRGEYGLVRCEKCQTQNGSILDLVMRQARIGIVAAQERLAAVTEQQATAVMQYIIPKEHRP